MIKDKKILVVYQWMFFFPKIPAFIQRDIDLLKMHFNVNEFFFKFKRLLFLPKKIKNSDVVFIWFAGYHAFITTLIARIIKRPVIVVTGGYDVACEPEINYGFLQNSLSRYMVRYTLKKANKVLAVSEFNRREIEKYLGYKNAEVIYNFVDTEYFKSKGKKENIVITIGLTTNNNLKRKGLETFVRTAAKLPNIRFYLIGGYQKEALDYLKSIATTNVNFTGYIDYDKLLNFYQRAKVCCQLSYYESFGLAPAEGMACECIPVVTKRAALPEVVGDTGFYVNFEDVDGTADAIKKALVSDNGLAARKRVITLFSKKLREDKLINTIQEMVK